MSTPTLPSTLHVEPWVDPVVDALGHDPRSSYVERFWLGVIGPTAVWLLRHLADRLDEAPEGVELDVVDTARSLGLAGRAGASSFAHTLERCATFGHVRIDSDHEVAARRRLAPLSRRQLERLPDRLKDEHQAWLSRSLAHPDAEVLRRRARSLALSLLELGEDYDATERQLHRWKFHPAIAHQAVKWAWAERISRDDGSTGSSEPAGGPRPSEVTDTTTDPAHPARSIPSGPTPSARPTDLPRARIPRVDEAAAIACDPDDGLDLPARPAS